MEMTDHSLAKATRTGLAAWTTADLPPPFPTRGLNILGAIGPGIIILGVSIGSGEWLLGPTAFVQYGLALLWVTTVAVSLQTIFNTEVIRYTLYTGEPIFTGFMRTRPGINFWAIFYVVLYFLQVGWPVWAGAAATAIFYLFLGRLPYPTESESIYTIGVITFLLCVIILLSGRNIERTLETFNWILVLLILLGLTILCVLLVPHSQWLATLLGGIGFDVRTHTFNFIPAGADWFLIGAFAAYSGAGGMVNLMLASWARDRGYGMGRVVGFIPAAIGGRQISLAPAGTVFKLTPENLQRWREWWRLVQIDQWGVFWLGALIGMGLPAMLYTTFIQYGRDISGPTVAAELARVMAERGGIVFTHIVAIIGAWILFKTQLNILDGLVRAVTDIVWVALPAIRRHSGDDVRRVYYAVLFLAVLWGVTALRLTEPVLLLELGANMAGIAFTITGLHVLYVNTTLLPRELQPSLWRRAALVALSLFYGAFVYLWLFGGLIPDPSKGFLFNISKYLRF
jgi:hypothetical protein